MSIELKCQVFLAAGGNPTGVVVLPDASLRSKYAAIAREFMDQDGRIEQFGFLENGSHFQMSGGEFCGNAARVAARLVAASSGRSSGKFTMSGFEGDVLYSLQPDNQVRCDFPGLPMQITKQTLRNGMTGVLVDFGGIVHFVVSPDELFNADPSVYQSVHAQVVQELGLASRAAVGVVWQDQSQRGIKIDPVVWVKDIDSFFYESACGSGTLAVFVAGGHQELFVIQPTGQSILAFRNQGVCSLVSEILEA